MYVAIMADHETICPSTTFLFKCCGNNPEKPTPAHPHEHESR